MDVSKMESSDLIQRITEKKIEGRVVKAKIKKQFLQYRVKVPKLEGGDRQYVALRLSYSAKREQDAAEYRFPVKVVRFNKQEMVLESVIDLESIEFKPLFWTFTLVVRIGGAEYEMELVNRSVFDFLKQCSLFYDNSYEFSDGMFVYPYISGARNVSLQYRKKGDYDDYRIKLKERIALLRYAVTAFVLKKKNIWLVFEKYSQMAQDNGYYFFCYCMENNIEERMNCKIYYVIDKDSKDREKIEKYKDNILDFMSIRHITYALGAKLLISTDAKDHIYPWRKRGSALVYLIKRKKLVFLQHGVTAMKRVDFFYGKGKRGQCDMFITTSEFEKQIVLDHFGYKENQIPVTGFARWDVLEDKSNGGREVLIMPTWRSWLEDCQKEVFCESEYYKHYMQLIENPRFYQMLEKYDLTVNFYLHPKFKDYIGEFASTSNRVRFIAFGEEPLNEIMMKSRMLVTDYSSVSWDMFYQKKPVVFYQFDRKDYLDVHGSYIDMEHELFGPSANTASELLEAFESCVKNEFRLTSEQEKQYREYYKYIDDQNSARICKAIREERLG